jgi:hypothetical protein
MEKIIFDGILNSFEGMTKEELKNIIKEVLVYL